MTACGSNGTGKSSSSSPNGENCASLVGQPVDTSAQCTAPIDGLTSPKKFPCYEGGGDFYYFRLKDRFVYGKAGDGWRQMSMPANGSLGEIATDLGC